MGHYKRPKEDLTKSECGQFLWNWNRHVDVSLQHLIWGSLLSVVTEAVQSCPETCVQRINLLNAWTGTLCKGNLGWHAEIQRSNFYIITDEHWRGYFRTRVPKGAQEEIISNSINKHINLCQVPQLFYPLCPFITNYMKKGSFAEEHNVLKLPWKTG